MIAAGLFVTILVHGGAAISVGLALATANVWLRRALVTAVGLTVLGILAMRSLLALLASRTSFRVVGTLRAVMIWNIVVALFATGLLMCTIWVWKRRRIATSKSSEKIGLTTKKTKYTKGDD
jgi:hypothetical protein